MQLYLGLASMGREPLAFKLKIAANLHEWIMSYFWYLQYEKSPYGLKVLKPKKYAVKTSYTFVLIWIVKFHLFWANIDFKSKRMLHCHLPMQWYISHWAEIDFVVIWNILLLCTVKDLKLSKAESGKTLCSYDVQLYFP